MRRQSAPAVQRNREPILAVLRNHLPRSGRALEIASGTGEHCIAFARAFPGIAWQPSDMAQDALESIEAWRQDAGLANVAPPLHLDVSAPDWPLKAGERADAILAINLVHISPWSATEGLMQGAERLLSAGGLLYLYGPYKRGGAHTAPSNADFEGWLKRQDTAWGVRELEDVEALGAAHGLMPESIVEMPANNLSLIFRKGGSPE